MSLPPPTVLAPPTLGDPTYRPAIPPKKKLSPSWRAGIILASLIGAIIVIGGIIEGVKAASKDAQIQVSYTMAVYDGCASDGYTDIPNGEAEIFDGSGKLLGYGTMNSGYYDHSREACMFTASFTIDKSGDGMYRATVGNTFRGYVNYNESDIESGHLYVEEHLG